VGVEPLCVRCARHTRTCCQGTDIYVTSGDVRRIGDYTGRRDFCEFRRPANPEYADQNDDPLWQANVFRPDGSRRVLHRAVGGDCVFLGANGCVLPMEARPLICRLYPYQYNEQQIFDEPAEGCPQALLLPGENLFDAVGMNLDAARQWHQLLYWELRQETPQPCTLV